VCLALEEHLLPELSVFFPELGKFKGSEKNKYIVCPFHKNDREPSLCYNEIKNMFSCFGCGESGTPVEYYAKRKGVSQFKAMVELAVHFRIKLTFKNVSPDYPFDLD
jgi:DNA primase